MADDKPIIIIKKKGGHGGHHGGAWKVAYADFVTAMMAFFMVMWLINTAETAVKQAIASYFRKPGIFESGSGTPLLIGEAGILDDGSVPPHPEDTKQLYPGKSKEWLLEKSGTDRNTTGDKRITYRGDDGKRDSVPDDDVAQRGFESEAPDNPAIAKELGLKKAEAEQLLHQQQAAFGELISEFEKQVGSLTGGEGGKVLGDLETKIDKEGLHIEIMDTEKSSMFQSGSARILPDAENAFQSLAPLLAKLPNKIEIVGHTDAKPFSSRPGGYSNWELSADRANAARRLLEKAGLPSERFGSVMGRADKELKNPTDPFSPANRRITLSVKFTKLTESDDQTIKDLSKQLGERGVVLKESEIAPTERAPSPTSELFETPQSPPPPTTRVVEPGNKRDRIKLPEGSVPVDNPPPPPGRNLIFDDNPVVGPVDTFGTLR